MNILIFKNKKENEIIIKILKNKVQGVNLEPIKKS